jgi:hypothetical protein
MVVIKGIDMEITNNTAKAGNGNSSTEARGGGFYFGGSPLFSALGSTMPNIKSTTGNEAVVGTGGAQATGGGWYYGNTLGFYGSSSVGEISGNRVRAGTGGSKAYGGGLYIMSPPVTVSTLAEITMSAGTISGNYAFGDGTNEALDAPNVAGGGVYVVNTAVFKKTAGGVIFGRDNTVATQRNCVYYATIDPNGDKTGRGAAIWRETALVPTDPALKLNYREKTLDDMGAIDSTATAVTAPYDGWGDLGIQ